MTPEIPVWLTPILQAASLLSSIVVLVLGEPEINRMSPCTPRIIRLSFHFMVVGAFGNIVWVALGNVPQWPDAIFIAGVAMLLICDRMRPRVYGDRRRHFHTAERLTTEEEYVAYVTYDPPSLADGAGAEVDITVTDALLGDTAEASFSLDTQGINVDAQVTATNLVTVRLQNETGSTVDLGSGALRVRVNTSPTRIAQRSSAGALWDSIGFEQDLDTSAKVSVHAPYAWNDGRITAVRIVFCMSGGNASKQARMRFRAVSVAPLYPLSTPSVDDSVDITVNDNALRVQEYKHTFSTPIDYARGNYLGLRIGRVGSHANDNASGVLHLLGAHLIYEGEGPDSPGSGPYDQSVDYV